MSCWRLPETERARIGSDGHAEIVALREAARKVGQLSIHDAVVYSTIEPCVMCAGALIQARVRTAGIRRAG